MKVGCTQRGYVDHELIWGSIALLLIAAAAVIPFDRVGAQCVFLCLTGIPCPTCGGTRAVVAMSHLRFAEGFHWNPLMAAGWVCAALFVPYAAIVCTFRLRRLRMTNVSRRERTTITLLALGLLLANWAYVIVRG